MGSHDFIVFPPYELIPTASVMMLLGEIQAKIEQISQIPISPGERERLKTLNFARAVHGTTAIEGNPLSEEYALRMVSGQKSESPPQEYSEQEVHNIIDVLNEIADEETVAGGVEFSTDHLNRYHRIVVSGTGSKNCEDDEIGNIRHRVVQVGRYLGAPARECPQMMEQFCDWLNQPRYEPRGYVEGYKVVWQVVKAIIAHIYFEWIHPYCDGNGRLGRLIEFKILFRARIPDIAAHLFSNMYNKHRVEYVAELKDSHGDYDDGSYPVDANIQRFLEFALKGFRNELDKQRLEIYNSQITVIWHDYIHASFPKNPTNVQQRRKQLALDLTQPRFQEKSVQFGEIRDLTPALAVAYLKKTDRTIRNDLNALVDMKLLQRDEAGYKPNTEILHGFFGPTRVDTDSPA